jgi:flagellar hook-associated protein 1 FlgK
VRTVGTLTLTAPSGGSVDLIASKSVRSGEIAALLEMRDQVLVEAQSQLDQIAAALASALSDRTTAGAAVMVGAQAGYEVDIGGVLAGNTIKIAYTDTIGGIQHRVTIVRVDDPASLPLPATATTDPDDIVIGVDFSGGIAAVVAELNAALGPSGLQFSNPGGTVLRVLDDGAGNTSDVDSLAAIATVTTLTGGSAELPFFLDGNGLYTGAIVSARPQAVGLASRIAVNPALLADPTRLVVYQTSPLTLSGDATRPDFILDRLTGAVLEFSPLAGIGTAAAPFRGSLPAYLRQMLAQQGQAAEAAERLRQGQDIVVNALRQRFEERSGVSIDTEMAHLLQLQTAYSANARIMSAIRELFDRLLEA